MGENSFITLLILFNLIFIIFIGAIVIFIREYRVKKKAHVAQVESINTSHKKALLETQLEIQEQTMRYIGQEIHDNIGQKLTLASIYLQQLDYENKVPDMNERIHPINDILNQSLIELRQLSKTLTDDTISSLSISELLSRECQKIKHLKTFDITFNDTMKSDIDSYRVKSIILRITQEFFQNSIKHANCKNIAVSLSTSEDKVCLTLKDDGQGFNPLKKKENGIGLENMKKRTEMLNGKFNLSSTHEQGTELKIEIPL